MATFWVSTAGTNTASGTNLASAKKTVSGALTAASQGDTINMVNDGTHSGTVTAMQIWTGWVGSDFTTDPGVHIRGCDTNGDAAMCTVGFNTTNSKWLQITYAADYVWLEGMRFDYSSLLNVNMSGMSPVLLQGNCGYVRLNDCECVMSTSVGSTVDFGLSTQVPNFPAATGSSASKSGDLELYNNMLVNARLQAFFMTTAAAQVHHNVIIIDGQNHPATTFPFNASSGATNTHRFYKNTIVHRAWFNEQIVNAAILENTDNTTNIALYDNLLYTETGSTAAANTSSFRIKGYSAASQETTAQTFGNNYIAIGPEMGADAVDWDTSTITGVYSYQLNETWRAGGANDGTNLNSNDVFSRSVALADVFSGTTSSYTWTPGNYDHNLPYDMRPLVGRTAATDGGVVGAVVAAINADPIVIAHTYTGTSGVSKTTSATNGVLAGSSDPDGDTLSVTIVSAVGDGVMTLNGTDGSFVYASNLTFSGTDTFTYKAWDGTTFSNVATGTINVSNTTPTVSNVSYATTENQEITGNLLTDSNANANDVGQTVTLTNASTPSHGTFNIFNTTTGEFEYEPNAMYAGTDLITFYVTDGNTQSAVATMRMRITATSAPITDSPEFLDTYPFFRPTLYVETEFRIKSKKNRQKDLDLSNYTDEHVWNESSSRAITITAGSTVEVTMGGVSTAKYLILETDQDLEVSIDGTDKYWPVSKAAAVALTEFSSITLHSLSTTNAQVLITVAD